MATHDRTLMCVLCALLACVFSIDAMQAKPTETAGIAEVDPAWKLSFESPIAWQRITPLGHLLVSTSQGLHGVTPDSGRIAWTRSELGPLSEDLFEIIPGTPFVVIAEDATPRRVVVLDSMEGRTIFDSKQAGIRELVGKNVLFRSGSLLVFGIPEGSDDPVMALYDIATGERRWTNTTVFARPKPSSSAKAQKPKGKFLRMMEKVAARNGQPPRSESQVTPTPRIETEPIELGSDAFLLSSNKGLFRIDARTGEVDWKVGRFLKSTCRVFLSPGKPELFVVGNRYTHTVNDTVQSVESVYRAFDAATGEETWDRPVRLDGELNRPIFHERGLVLSPQTTAKGLVKFVDYATGSSLWGKNGRGIKVPGGIVDSIVIGNEIVLTTGHDNAWTNKGTEYSLNILDVGNGALRFKKPHKVKGRMLATEVLAKGILYVTTSEMNVLDPTTGQPLHKSVVSEDSLIATTDGDHVYAFSSKDRSLYVLDKTDASLRKISEAPIKLGEGEVPFSLEIDERQITVVSSQNIAAFDPTGSLRFHSYHPAPRRSGLMRALLMANAVRAGIASAATGVYSGAFAGAAIRQEPGSAGNTITAAMAEGYGEMAVGYGSVSRSYAQAARERFKASANSADFVFMMVRLPDRRFGLAQVSKTDGSIVALIDLHKDKTPSYEVDSISNRIYYRLQPNELVGYRFESGS